MSQRTWTITDHLCRDCGGRILKCATNSGPTGGGNPLFHCANCGAYKSGMTESVLCWCGFSHRLNHGTTAYLCLPFSIIETKPEIEPLFRACGCDPKRGEVGIVLESQYRAFMSSK